jgi:predicted  nucleic acid-binding Zn-ribbon protein
MKSETETKNMKKTEEYRNNITLHLVKITGELAHIREKVEANHTHLERINGRLTTAEHSITAIKTIGSTLTIVVGAVLTWLGLEK